MGINELKNQLLQEAKEKERLLQQEAHQEERRIREETDRELKQHENMARDNAAKMIETTERKEMAAAEFEGRKSILDKKKEIVEKAVEEAKKELREMPHDKKAEMLKHLLSIAAKEIEVKRVFVDSRDRRDVEAEAGKDIEVLTKQMAGGLQAETEDGKIIVDLSFESLLEIKKNEHLQELGKVLFGG